METLPMKLSTVLIFTHEVETKLNVYEDPLPFL